MADAFKGVVMLLVAAGVFAQGLMSIGAIDNLIGLAESAEARRRYRIDAYPDGSHGCSCYRDRFW